MIAAAAVVLLLGLLGAAAISGVLPVAVSKPAVAIAIAQGNASPQPRLAQAVRCASCGVVEAIRTVEVHGETNGLGAAAGGANGGHQIEKHLKKSTAWRITVRLDDGSVRTLSRPAAPPFAIGDRVRIVNGSGVERV
jgi:outer membrane lipoprotein SlyB